MNILTHSVKFILILCIFGCGISGDNVGEPVTRSLPIETSKEGTSPKLFHDFGTLHPGQVVFHDFVVTNPTRRTWQLTKITQSCTCSVASGPSKSIPPGGQANFKFEYHAPAKTADERRSVTLSFGDTVEDSVDLVISAWVRPPMTPNQEQISFGNIAIGKLVERSVDLGNFGSGDWAKVDIEHHLEWLTIKRVAKAERRWSGAKPRETWSIGLQVSTSNLKPGKYREALRFVSDTGECGNIIIEFTAGDSIVAIPSLLMLGKVQTLRSISATMRLRFFGGGTEYRPEDLNVSAIGVRLVEQRIQVISKTVWELSVVIEPTGKPGDFVSGQIILTLPEKGTPALAIPVHAQIGFDL